jgi:L,D-transpeptidase ErfK/SrfK
MTNDESGMTIRQGLALAAALLAGSAAWILGTSLVTAPMSEADIPQPILASQAARQSALQRKLAQHQPADVYIVVDTARNRLYVKRQETVLLQAVVSTGSGSILDAGTPGARWTFDTPRGVYPIISKIANPVWVKPDWAFIEEGVRIPKDPSERMEGGMLGDYALGFGNGYFIHGTLYTRLLGKNVTHGCIRLNDDDLRRVYQLAKIGTPLFIF